MSRDELLRMLPLLAMLLLSIALAMGLFNDKQSEIFAKNSQGRKFANFEIASLGSDKIFSPQIFAGKVVLVNVFASWCVPCAAEHEMLMKLTKKVNIYGVAWKDKPDAVFRYLQERGNPFQQVANDEKGELTVPMFLTGVPETFVLNKEGKIMLHYRSALTEDIVNKLIIPLIDALNKEPRPVAATDVPTNVQTTAPLPAN